MHFFGALINSIHLAKKKGRLPFPNIVCLSATRRVLSQESLKKSFFKNHFKYIFSDSSEIFIKPKKYNYVIEIGNLELIENKLMNYKFFYATKIKGKDLEDIKTINLRYANQVILERK